MTNRGDLLALASALSGGEEVTLGPTDMAMCAAALKFYANEQTKAGLLKMMKVPALVATVFLGTLALGGSSIGLPTTDVAMKDVSSVPVAAYVGVVKRYISPVPHTTPESLEMQRYAAAYPNEG